MAAVTTRAKLYIASYTASLMMLLSVFAKPLHLSSTMQWGLLVGAFVPIGLLFYFNKQQKLEQQKRPGTEAPPAPDRKDRAKKGLLSAIILVSLLGLGAPFWLPLTGTSLGFWGDLGCGILTIAVTGTICGPQLRKL